MVQQVSATTRATHDIDLREPMAEEELREVAIKRLEKKRDFRNHLFTYAVINTMLWSIWVVAGFVDGWQFPWAVFPTVVWGLFLLRHYRDTYMSDPLSEDRIQQEMGSLKADF